METYALVMVISIWPLIAKAIWKTSINMLELLLNIIIPALIVMALVAIGAYSKTSDVQVINGEILSKERNQGHYVESYSCHCVTRTVGKTTTTSCQTCYRDHYTVEWLAKTNIGIVPFDSKDSTSRAIYLSPDPLSYVKCEKGQPASLTSSWTNYIQAAPRSLFNSGISKNEFAGKIPTYPLPHDFYKMNRVLDVSSKLSPPILKELNDKLNQELKILGPSKQANVVLILTSIQDQSYRYAVENAWLGGKKNDIVVFIGVEGNTIAWTDVMTWAKNINNESLQVKLRDDLFSLQKVNVDSIISVISSDIKSDFKRVHEDDFKYLESEIDPPTWAIVLALVLGLSCSFGLTYYFHKNEIGKF